MTRNNILTDIKWDFCTNKGNSKRTIIWNLAYLGMGCSVSLKYVRKLVKWRKKNKVANLNKTTADEQFQWVTSLRNRKEYRKELAQDLKNTSGPSVYQFNACLNRNGLTFRVTVKERSEKRYNSECPQPSVKHSEGSVMVWDRRPYLKRMLAYVAINGSTYFLFC